MTDTDRDMKPVDACEPWPQGCWTPPEGTDAAVAADCWDAACDIVWALTGRRTGVCTYSAWFGQVGYETCLPQPMLWQGRWYNFMLGPYDCCRIRLAPGPVTEVIAVIQEGVPLAADEDYFMDGSWLVSAEGCWPVDFPCYERKLKVIWTGGLPPTGLEVTAASELATELCKACVGDPACKLPSRLVSITRLGVTVQLGDATLLLQQGYIGLPAIDLAIRALNPNQLTHPSRTYSPDVIRPQWS